MDEEGSVLAGDIRTHFLVLLSGGLIVAAASFLMANSYRSRAVINSVNVSLAAQGRRTDGDQLKTDVAFYNGPSIAYEDKNVLFIQKNGVYSTDVGFGVGFNYGDKYAMFIKPEKHIGKLFCTEVASGSACTVPQFIFLASGSTADLSKSIFLAGDIPPGNGKVDAQDMSLIMKNLGKLAYAPYAPTDLNDDGITDVVDYSLALYSLSKNAADDPVNLQTPIITPSATPTPTFSLFPSSTLTPSPVPSATPIPTAVPTGVPTNTPTPMPTNTPTPTPTPMPTNTPIPTPSVKVPDYSKIAAMAHDYGQVGCPSGSVSGCPADTLYNTPMNQGLGWATHYGPEHGVVATVIKNRKGISLEAANKFVDDNYMQKQSDLTPEEAKKSGKVIAFAATRGPKDLWKIKYMFGIDDPKNPKPYFIGRIMIIDCAASYDWNPRLATLLWGYKGWSPSLNWIVDLSSNGFIQIPTGLSGQQGNTGEGRPGVVLIDESILDQMIY